VFIGKLMSVINFLVLATCKIVVDVSASSDFSVLLLSLCNPLLCEFLLFDTVT
jgi:hypothetical protein